MDPLGIRGNHQYQRLNQPSEPLVSLNINQKYGLISTISTTCMFFCWVPSVQAIARLQGSVEAVVQVVDVSVLSSYPGGCFNIETWIFVGLQL